jgi:uncharacterized protein with FMN-binding domain
MAQKMSRRMVVLSISAITTVYLAGYVITQPAAQQIARAETSGSAAPLTPSPSHPLTSRAAVPTLDPPRSNPSPTLSTLPTLAPAGPTAQPTALPTRVVPPSPTSTPLHNASGLADGTFVGLGRSRRGDVEVTLTIQSGKIVTADISHCMTQYPQSVIDGLPSEVVERQSADVDLVSGATYSSRAFQDAVRQALTQSHQADANAG